ncbi:MAG: hypothetical protein FWG67_06045 [Defluviitaleaceae bacterium]|nr:hypothetical protein [Defluviitaleaceae bacterium]
MIQGNKLYETREVTKKRLNGKTKKVMHVEFSIEIHYKIEEDYNGLIWLLCRFIKTGIGKIDKQLDSFQQEIETIFKADCLEVCKDPEHQYVEYRLVYKDTIIGEVLRRVEREKDNI